jgi:hypothetical protein
VRVAAVGGVCCTGVMCADRASVRRCLEHALVCWTHLLRGIWF